MCPATADNGVPRTLELGPSRRPRWLRLGALSITGAALALSGMPISLAALAGVAVYAALRRWRPASPRRVSVTPERLTLTVADQTVTVDAPFRALLRPGWLALHCPGRGWVWLFDDQASPRALTPLRQVLWLRARP